MPLFTPNHLSGAKPSWHIANVLTQFDSFGRAIPSFTLKGETEVKTAIGGLLTVAVTILVAIFAFTKAHELANPQNPTINSINLPNAIDEEETINIGDSNFRFAFNLEGFGSKGIEIDERYVRWRVRNYGRRDGEYFQNMIPIHKCTKDEMAEFYPISPKWANSYSRR